MPVPGPDELPRRRRRPPRRALHPATSPAGSRASPSSSRPAGGAVAGVDVRGGGPGTRETDLLDPRNLVDRVNAVVLGGGSAFGLAAVDGVMDALLDDGQRLADARPPGPRSCRSCRAAILFDLGRGGTWGHRPRAEDGRAAYAAATTRPCRPGQRRRRHRGQGRRASRAASARRASCSHRAPPSPRSSSSTRSARPSTRPPGCRMPWAWASADEFAHVGPAERQAELAARARGREALPASAEARPGTGDDDRRHRDRRDADQGAVPEDGRHRARRPRPGHSSRCTPSSTATPSSPWPPGRRPAPDPVEQTLLMEAGADCVARAIVHAMLAADVGRPSADGGVALRSWSDAFPSAGGSRAVTVAPRSQGVNAAALVPLSTTWNSTGRPPLRGRVGELVPAAADRGPWIESSG